MPCPALAVGFELVGATFRWAHLILLVGALLVEDPPQEGCPRVLIGCRTNVACRKCAKSFVARCASPPIPPLTL